MSLNYHHEGLLLLCCYSHQGQKAKVHDNPRDENPDDIIVDMTKGLQNNNYEIEINREKAIIKGIQKLTKNDILLVLGKGHETYQIIN